MRYIVVALLLVAALASVLPRPRAVGRWIQETIGAVLLWALYVIHELRVARRGGRRLVRRPIRSTRRDAKRAARSFASNYAGRELSWKAARKLLARLERKLAPES